MHTALLDYFKRYPQPQAPFMHRQFAEWSKSKPLSGYSVLHHVPLVPNTLLKIACLVAAGADITVTNPSSFIAAHPEAVACLREANIRYVDNLSQLQNESFDLYLDCGAELYQALGRPRIGAIELTGSGDQYYRAQQLDFPVVSIDKTYTKQLETVFGSAESANVAIAEATQTNPAKKAWMIFGFGKIGRGLAYFCVQMKTPVVVVDCCPEARAAAQLLGITALSPGDTEALEIALADTDIVITATGVKALLNQYPRAWFNHKILANMGVYDEYGEQFSAEEVLNNKTPVNFLLDDPTPIRYIDPEFYAHNIAALQCLANSTTGGVSDLSSSQDQSIIQEWCAHHEFPLTIIQEWFIDLHRE